MSRPFNGILVSQVGSLSLGQEEGSPALYQWHKVLIDCYAVAWRVLCSSWKKLRFEFWSWRGRLAVAENFGTYIVRNPIGSTCMGIYGRRTEHNRQQIVSVK